MQWRQNCKWIQKCNTVALHLHPSDWPSLGVLPFKCADYSVPPSSSSSSSLPSLICKTFLKQARQGLRDECPCWFSNKRLHVGRFAKHTLNVFFEHWMWALKVHKKTFQCIYAHMYTIPFKWPEWHFNKLIWVFVKANTDVCLSVHQLS